MTQDQSGGAPGKRQRGTAEPTSPLPPTAAQRMARARLQIVLLYAVIKNSPQRPYVHESKRSEQSGCLSADVRNMYIVSTATLRRARPQRWSKARCVVPSLSSPQWICAAHTLHDSWRPMADANKAGVVLAMTRFAGGGTVSQYGPFL